MTSFLLVPGAGGDSWYWHRVVALLERSGHEAVAVDLPAGDDDAGLGDYCERVVAAGAGLGSVTLVAQSMGAYAATMAVADLDVDRLVLCNAMVPAPGESPAQWWSAVGQPAAARAAAEAEGRPVDFDPVRDFFHDVPDSVRQDAFRRGEPAQSERPFGEPWPLESWPDVPTRVIASTGDRLFPVGLQQQVARDRLGAELEITGGGHLVALSEPVLLADLLSATRH